MSWYDQYYLRTRAAVGAIKFTVDQATLSLSFTLNYFVSSPNCLRPRSAQAKLDNKKPNGATPPPTPKPTILASPTAPAIREITAQVSATSLSPAVAPTTLSSRFDKSSTTPSPAPASPIVDASKVPVEEGEMTYEQASAHREQKELEQARLLCSLENKDACVSTYSFLYLELGD